MLSRRSILLCGLVLGAWVAGQTVSPLMAWQDGTSATSAAANEDRELSIRYAEAYLRLMEARLAEFEERNRLTPNTIRPAAMQLVQEYAAKARQRLESLRNGTTDGSQTYVLRAEAELRVAEENLRRAEAVRKRVANGVSPSEITRLAAQRDLARLKVEKARHVASESPQANIRFEIDQLQEEVQELRLLDVISRRGA